MIEKIAREIKFSWERFAHNEQSKNVKISFTITRLKISKDLMKIFIISPDVLRFM